MEILRRIVCLILFPRTEFRQIATETPSVDRLIRHYILPLSLLAPIATVIGMKTFDAAWDPLHGYTVPADQIFAAGATTLFASIGSVFVLAAIFVGSSRRCTAAAPIIRPRSPRRPSARCRCSSPASRWSCRR